LCTTSTAPGFPQQDADEGAHLDQAIAADQFLALQLLRQVGVFDRPEQGGMDAHADHGGDQQPQVMGHPAIGGDAHDGDFQQLHEARHPALFQLVGQLAGGGREQEERQDEQTRNEVVEQARIHVRPRQGVIGEDGQQRVLNTLSLRAPRNWVQKKGEAPLGEELELAVLLHGQSG
jgi:hypothetical protein